MNRRRFKVNHASEGGLPGHLVMTDAEIAGMEKLGWFYHDGQWKIFGADYQVCAERGDRQWFDDLYRLRV